MARLRGLLSLARRPLALPAFSLPRLAAALALVLAGLLGRALVDKALAAQGGATAVAAWSQLSSVAEVVSGVSLTGIGPALTVLAAGAAAGRGLAWLKPGLCLGLALSLAAACLGAGFLALLPAPLVPQGEKLPFLALASGWLATAAGLLTAFLNGIGRPGRAAALVGLGFLPPLACLFLAPADRVLEALLAGQAVFGLAVLAGLGIFLRRQEPVCRRDLATLLRFVPAGLAIGILSPATLAWARTEIAASLSWHAAGQVQALWRTSDWITAIMGGLLNAYFLPRLGAAGASPAAFREEMGRILRAIALPAALLLGGLWLVLPEALALLYRNDIGVSRQEALFFLLGDWLRVLSWVPLIGLFVRRASWAITAGEFLSLPLFACLLTLFAGRFGFREVGMLWCATYGIYWAFNALALHRSLGRWRA